jgi:hypothetical protein
MLLLRQKPAVVHSSEALCLMTYMIVQFMLRSKQLPVQTWRAYLAQPWVFHAVHTGDVFSPTKIVAAGQQAMASSSQNTSQVVAG